MTDTDQPEQHAGVSPITGHAPPVKTRWKPGQSGNPGGYPKGVKHASGRRAAMRELSIGWENDPNPDAEEKLGDGARAIGLELIEAALAGDTDRVRAIATLLDQVEGKPQERVEHSGSTSISATFTDPRAPEVPPSSGAIRVVPEGEEPA